MENYLRESKDLENDVYRNSQVPFMNPTSGIDHLKGTVVPVRVVRGKTDSLSISSVVWIKPWEEGTISTVSSSIVG